VIEELSREAEVVAIDEATLTWEVLEFARVKIRVQNIGSVRWARIIQINGHKCSVLVEEEPIGCLGWGCKENFSWDASSDSVSSSETYVEETAFSERSGEKRSRQSCDDDRRATGEEGGGDKDGEGEHPWLKSTLLFMEPGKGGQGKGRLSAPFGARQRHKGRDGSLSVISPDMVCGGAVSSNLFLHEATKTVIEVECLINQVTPSKAMGWVNNVEAHSSTGGPFALAQREEACVGCFDLYVQEVTGPRGAGSNEVDMGGMEACAAMLKSVRNEGEITPQLIAMVEPICLAVA